MTSKPYNGGQWTVARFNSFIKSALRTASTRWPPRNITLKKARISRGVYRCEGYKKRWHRVPVSIPNPKGGPRIRNVFVDHIYPVIDPTKGFISWDDVIERMFCEEEDFQILCKDCHDRKTADERKKGQEYGKRK